MSDTVIRDIQAQLMNEAARYRDRLKGECGEAGVALWECDRGHTWDKTVDLAQNVRCMNCAAERRELETTRLRDLAYVRGGTLLSRRYTDAATPLRWKCAYGHEWEARADTASRCWCIECARTVFAGFR